MRIVLMDRNMSECRSQQGDDIRDAIEGFWSSIWEQGYDPDAKILEVYGDWTIFEETPSGKLIPLTQLKDHPVVHDILRSK